MRTFRINYKDYNPNTKIFIGMGTVTVDTRTEKEAPDKAIESLKSDGHLAILVDMEHITEKMKIDYLDGKAFPKGKVKKIN